MAKHHPNLRPTRAETTKSEIEVWDALSDLSNAWHVYHSVALREIQQKRTLDKEIDFVLVNRQKGVIVLEVKAGTPKVEDGQWYQRDTDTREWIPKRSPFEQVKDNAYALGRKLKERVPGLGEIPIARAVVFPDSSRGSFSGLDVDDAMLWGADEVRVIQTAVDELAPASNWSLMGDQFNSMHRLLAPTHQYRLTIGSQIGRIEDELIDLTNDQIRTVKALRHVRRGLVIGGAGTGKTILATERAQDLAAEGASVFLTCFNKPLGELIARRVGSVAEIKAQHRDGYAFHLIKRAQLVVPERTPSDWYEDVAPDLFVTAIERLGVQFDAVIVDEGQDFSAAWMTSLQYLLKDPDDGPFFVFADPEQSIYQPGWEPPFGEPVFQLDENCRNTRQIAERCAAVLGVGFASRATVGVPPLFVEAEDEAAMVEELNAVVGRLIVDDQVAPDGIVILSDRRSFADDLVGSSVGGEIVTATPRSGVSAETIHRFKGLESPVIVAVIHDAKDVGDRRLAYIGMSRAMAHLTVIASAETKHELNWA